MKRKYTKHNRAVDPMLAIAENLRVINELLPQLALKVGEIEGFQSRFRSAVCVRLSRIEAQVNMIHGAQIAEAHLQRPEDLANMEKLAKHAEDEIDRQSQEIGLKMVKYIHGGIGAVRAGQDHATEKRD